jgi:hypothetical protein
MRTILLGLALLSMTGCGPTLAQLQAQKPEEVATVRAEYKWLAACAKERAQMQNWWFDYYCRSPRVYTIESVMRPLTRLYVALRDPMFEMTFQPAGAGLTRVEYRQPRPRDPTKQEAWPIIARCVSQLSAAPAPPGPLQNFVVN